MDYRENAGLLIIFSQDKKFTYETISGDGIPL